MKALSKLILIVFVVCGISACHENRFNPNKELTLDEYSSLVNDAFAFNTAKINESIGRMCRADRDTFEFDVQTRQHYLGTEKLLWVSRMGLTPQADTLISYISRVGEIGFSTKRFRLDDIERDANTMRNLAFDKSNDINTVAARLDYNLTKAFLAYYVGQRYGFVKPRKEFNHLLLDANDTLKTTYRQLYDLPTESLDKEGYQHLLEKIAQDSVPDLLRSAEPQGPFYKKLKSMLPEAEGAQRNRILANMERCRWRHDDYPHLHDKYVVVNIPSYRLMAVDKDSILTMNVVCGAQKTKTPLVNSRINLMELNPRWVMPSSVVKYEIAHHAGDSMYFASRNYVITEKSTGKRMSPHQVSFSAFRSGAYGVYQEGGEGNALGRIIFRFPNDFAIYLHDTSSKSAFGRESRSLSHGCIRVEKPYQLAEFLLEDKDKTTLEKINYSMNVRTRVSEDGETPEKIDKSKVIHSLRVKPEVPVFITYHTMYLMPDGTMRVYNDVYEYDQVLTRILNKFR